MGRMAKSTLRQFEREFRHALQVLGVSAWDIDIIQEKHRKHVELTADKSYHRAWLYVPKHWPKRRLSEGYLRHIAIHEAVHVVLNPLTLLAKDRERFISETELHEAIESVTVRLTAVIEPLVTANPRLP